MYYYLNEEEKCSVLAALELLAHARQQGWELPRKIEQMETSLGRYPRHGPGPLGELMDWIQGNGLAPWHANVQGQALDSGRARLAYLDLSGPDPLGAEVQDPQGGWWRVIGSERRSAVPERYRVTLERQELAPGEATP